MTKKESEIQSVFCQKFRFSLYSALTLQFSCLQKLKILDYYKDWKHSSTNTFSDSLKRTRFDCQGCYSTRVVGVGAGVVPDKM